MLNCWLRLRRHRWRGWQREDTWLNMYPIPGRVPMGILANRCSGCTRIKLKEIWREG